MNSVEIKTTLGKTIIQTELSVEQLFNKISNGRVFKAINNDDAEIDVFINPTFLVSIISTNYITPPTEVEYEEDYIKFESSDGKIYNNNGSEFSPDDFITIK